MTDRVMAATQPTISRSDEKAGELPTGTIECAATRGQRTSRVTTLPRALCQAAWR
jgi:hypothetical protein